MSTNIPQNQDDQEIDLSQISKKIGGFFENLKTMVFKGIQFVINHILIIGILFVTGVGIGIYMDKTNLTYNQQIIVQPNFGSTDYLYSKIDLIQSKIKESDTIFLKDIVGIKEPKKLKKIEIKPILDVYQFIENKDKNFELLKLMAEDGDINKILENKLTSKNYSFHTISFVTDKLINEKETVRPLLNFLNNTDYYNKIQKEYLNNIRTKMVQNDSIIAQINAVLNGFSNTVNSSLKSDKLIYYNENTQLNDVIKTKDALITEQGVHRIELLSLDKTIKENSTTINIKNTGNINGKLKFILPIIFLFIFILIRFFIAFYRKQALKVQLN